MSSAAMIDSDSEPTNAHLRTRWFDGRIYRLIEGDVMTNYAEATTLNEPPRGHARIVYLGSASPHWEVYGDYGDQNMLEEFRARTLARLILLPRNDPQFRRNQERVNKDAERERISIEWELGYAAAAETSAVAPAAAAETSAVAPAAATAE